MSYRYKVVETQTVTDESIETVLNEWVSEGWTLDSIKFAMSDASKRPAMAFILFVREDPVPAEENSDAQ